MQPDNFLSEENSSGQCGPVLLREESIQRQIFQSIVDISKVRPIHSLELIEVEVSVKSRRIRTLEQECIWD